jgi:hypothetical protein
MHASLVQLDLCVFVVYDIGVSSPSRDLLVFPNLFVYLSIYLFILSSVIRLRTYSPTNLNALSIKGEGLKKNIN